MREVKIEIKPREQFRAFLESDHKRSCLVVHRRGGKTFAEVQKLFKAALTHKRPGMKTAPLRYAYFAPTQAQAKSICWGYIKQFAQGIGKINESELHVTFPSNQNAQIRLYSGENYERARGIYLDGVVLDENGDMPPDAWESVIEPCLLDYDGWASFVGTPKGRNAFWRTHQHAETDPDWFSMVLKASESGIIDPHALARLKDTKDGKIYAREFECDFSADIPGAIYASEMEEANRDGRIVEFRPSGGGVYTTWDLGNNANTSVVYWEVNGPQRRVIDADNGLPMELTERVAHMMSKGYNYAAHFLPHDSKAQQANGVSFADECRRAGLQNVKTIPVTASTQIRIDATKRSLSSTWFRASTTQHLRDALNHYHYVESKDKTGWISNVIHKGWETHPADAFGMLAEAELHGFLSRPQHLATRKKRPKIINGQGY